MTHLLPRACTFAVGLLVALTHLGCSEELVLGTSSQRTTFEQGETVVVEVFDRKTRLTDSSLGSIRIRWSVRNTTHDTEYHDLGYGAELITSQLQPGKNLIYADVENDPGYRLPPGGGITINVTENGVLPPPAPKAPPQPDPAQPTPADPAASSASATPPAGPAPAQPATAAPTSGLLGGLGQ